MSDMIDRQAAIDALNKLKIYRPLDSDRYVISDCLNKIVNLPSAQPERKTGKWSVYDRHTIPYQYICSECGAYHRARYDFCPNCGADMRGDEDER